jgi:hypothetical protein
MTSTKDDLHKELVNAVLQFRLLAEVLAQDDPDMLLQVNQLVSELEDELQSLEARTTLTTEGNRPKESSPITVVLRFGP